MKLEKREYQENCIKELYLSFFEESKSLCALPTSAGKTHIFCELIRKCQSVMPGIKILVLINKINLALQNKREADLRGISGTSLFCASLGSKEMDLVTFATIQSVKNSPALFNLIILDEAHNLTPTVKEYYEKCLKLNPKLKLAGFTATPFNKEGLIYGKFKFFPRVTFTLPLSDLISMGYICDYILFDTADKFNVRKLKKQGDDYNKKELSKLVDDLPKAEKQVLDLLERTKGRKKIAIMCVDIKHATKIYDLLIETEKIGNAAITHSKLSKEDQAQEISWFENDPSFRFLVSVNQVSEGYSYTAIDAIVLLRPTRSPRLMVQMIGRGLRLHPGKENCLVLDYGDVLLTCGTPRKPFILSGQASKVKSIFNEYKSCIKCLAYNPREAKECFNCAYSFQRVIDVEKNLNEKPLVDLRNIETDQLIPVTSWKIDFNYVSKKGTRCIFIKFFTPRGMKMKWLFKPEDKKSFKILSENGTKRPKFIKVIKNEKNKTYPKIEEVWK